VARTGVPIKTTVAIFVGALIRATEYEGTFSLKFFKGCEMPSGWPLQPERSIPDLAAEMLAWETQVRDAHRL
jgi:hypothetical protein